MTERWDDWTKTCNCPTVWTGFGLPEIVETYVVLPMPAGPGPWHNRLDGWGWGIIAGMTVAGNAAVKAEKLDLIWSRTHLDYRGATESERYVLVLREGGTWSVPLTALTDEEIERLLPRSLEPHGAYLPIFPTFRDCPTEERLEREVERLIDRA